MNTLFQKMRNNRRKFSVRAPEKAGPIQDIEKRRSRVWKFIAIGGEINGSNDGFVSDDARVVLADPEVDDETYTYTGAEFNTEVRSFRSLLAHKIADPTPPPPPETQEQRWYRASAWFNKGAKS